MNTILTRQQLIDTVIPVEPKYQFKPCYGFVGESPSMNQLLSYVASILNTMCEGEEPTRLYLGTELYRFLQDLRYFTPFKTEPHDLNLDIKTNPFQDDIKYGCQDVSYVGQWRVANAIYMVLNFNTPLSIAAQKRDGMVCRYEIPAFDKFY